MVQRLAASGFLQGKLLVAFDGRKRPTPKSSEGCGKRKQTRRGKIKGQKETATEEYFVYGWNVLVLIEVHTRFPLAVQVVPIQESEGSWLLPLLEQAQANLGTHAQIETIVIDRDSLDGADLWQVDQKGIRFVIVGKSKRAGVADAQGIAITERARVRERVVKHGHGKTAREERVRTELVGIEALSSSDSSGDPEPTQTAHRREDEGKPITAVVLRRWDNRLPKGGGTVYLTNADGSDPVVLFDPYDWRSAIENGIFNEGNHPWHLLSFPTRTQAAVRVHVFFPLLVLALCTAFPLWLAQTALTPSKPTEILPTLSSTLPGSEGTARWRQRLREAHRDKIMVFIGPLYGIFHLADFAVLTPVPIRRLPPSLGSPQAVFPQFGVIT